MSQRSGQRDVVDVVPCRVGVHAGLPPTGHPPVDQPGIPLEAHIGPDAETLHDTRAETLDQAVSGFDEIEQRGDGIGVLEIEGYVASPA